VAGHLTLGGIFFSSDLIKEEIAWRIGNGTGVRIWRDKWFLQPTMYVVQSLPKFLPADAKVSNLIDNLSKWWNGHLIHSIFSKEEAEKILSFPLSKYGQCDLMIWRDSST